MRDRPKSIHQKELSKVTIKGFITDVLACKLLPRSTCAQKPAKIPVTQVINPLLVLITGNFLKETFWKNLPTTQI